MRRPRISILVLLLGLLWLTPAAVGAVEVDDQAGFFSEDALKQANAEIKRLQQKYDVELRVDTVRHVPTDKIDAVKHMNAEERAKFFHHWFQERAKEEHARGIDILICKDPAHLEVGESHALHERGFGKDESNRVRDELVKGFKQKHYDSALLGAIRMVDEIARDELKPAGHKKSEAPVPVHVANRPIGPAPRPGAHWGLWIGLGLVIVVGFLILSSLFRRPAMGGPAGGPGGPGYGGGYGGPGYGGPGYGGGGGGGWLGGLFSGMAGAMLGNWAYDTFRGHGQASGQELPHSAPPVNPTEPTGGYSSDSTTGSSDDDFSDSSGGDFGSDDSSSGSSGGDFGSDDSSGGDSGGDWDSGSGGDFGGSDDTGGDF